MGVTFFHFFVEKSMYFFDGFCINPMDGGIFFKVGDLPFGVVAAVLLDKFDGVCTVVLSF